CLAQSTPSSSSPKVSFNADLLDKAIDPCMDFYAYACSKWKAQNPIPSDRSSWGRFNELQERGELVIHDIREKYSTDDSKRTSNQQKIGEYFQGGMDTAAIEKAGTSALDQQMKAIAALKSKKDIAGELVRLHRMGINALFGFSSGQDFKDASQVIAE